MQQDAIPSNTDAIPSNTLVEDLNGWIGAELSALKRECDAVRESSDECYSTMLQYYFYSRYFVSEYEVSYGKLPIQVWNEYRNALDHFFRYQSMPDDSGAEHLSKMKGHLQRAAFDILKLCCHAVLKEVSESRANYSIEAYSFVDNGTYLSFLDDKYWQILSAFRRAKTCDLGFGSSDASDSDVLDAYLVAALSAMKLLSIMIEKKRY